MKGSNDKTMLSETRGLKSSSCVEIVTHTLALAMDPDMIMFNVQWSMFNEDLSGGYCSGVPPLPIPNREVKPACADGTAMQCGRVGDRPLFRTSQCPMDAVRLFFCLFFRYFQRKLYLCGRYAVDRQNPTSKNHFSDSGNCDCCCLFVGLSSVGKRLAA